MVATGATLGVMIPPSVVLIIIGLQTGQSISVLFLGSIIPGILLTIGFILAVAIICNIYKDLGPSTESTMVKDKLRAILVFGKYFYYSLLLWEV